MGTPKFWEGQTPPPGALGRLEPLHTLVHPEPDNVTFIGTVSSSETKRVEESGPCEKGTGRDRTQGHQGGRTHSYLFPPAPPGPAGTCSAGGQGGPGTPSRGHLLGIWVWGPSEALREKHMNPRSPRWGSLSPGSPASPESRAEGSRGGNSTCRAHDLRDSSTPASPPPSEPCALTPIPILQSG